MISILFILVHTLKPYFVGTRYVKLFCCHHCMSCPCLVVEGNMKCSCESVDIADGRKEMILSDGLGAELNPLTLKYDHGMKHLWYEVARV